jgi:hypothetical protein
MTSIVANTARVTEGPKVSADYLPLVGAVPTQVSQGKRESEPLPVDLCALLAAAIDATGQRKEAATDMQISGPVLTKQLTRVENAAPRLDRMSNLKRETLIDFAERIKGACGEGDPRVERRQSAERAVRAIGELVALVMSA